jgi:argininosuccinate synthase
MKKVVLAYSGGLDTTFCALHLSKDLGNEIHAVLVNTGGFSTKELQDIEQRAHALGVASFRILDVACLSKHIRASVSDIPMPSSTT